MNNDLISRSALREDFKARLAHCNEWIAKAKDKETKIRASAVKTFIGEVIITIDNAPTVDTTFKEGVAYECGQKSVEERPKGEWLPKGRWHIDPQCIEYTCSICGRRIMREERLNVIEQYPFCHCGADMRGDT